MQKSTLLILSLVLSALIIFTSAVGLLTPGFYAEETLNWQAQSIGQDFINLFIISPALVLSSILSFKNSDSASNIFSGILLYLIYTFVLYAFDVHFNILFVFYCFSLGLSFYLFVYSLLVKKQVTITETSRSNRGIRFIAIYFISISAVFYLLWLSEIVPSILSGTKPKSLVETGLFTNGVQVLDLSIVLPGIFLTGLLLLKKNQWGYIFAPIFLTFFVFMNITIASLIIIMIKKQLEANLIVAVVMIILALLSGYLLVSFCKYIRSQKKSGELNSLNDRLR